MAGIERVKVYCAGITEPLVQIKTISRPISDISYNVAYGPVPGGLPRGERIKEFAAVNNLCQSLFTSECLKVALPTVPMYCERFGISLIDGVYSITNRDQFEARRRFTGANPREFWLLNSYLIHIHGRVRNPIARLKEYMDKTVENDKYTVAEIPQWRDGWKRTFVFRSRAQVQIPRSIYFRKLGTVASLSDIIHYLRKHKKRAIFFRQTRSVEPKKKVRFDHRVMVHFVPRYDECRGIDL
ncbi:hypothetical protein J6590_085009 [Homalodisca vitripennis]|nr:hypothetical protein J6590_085009 [Homalodisca vitripennis]